MSDKRKEIYKKRKSLGICVKCGICDSRPESVTCEKCSKREANTLSKRRKNRCDASLCKECGKDVFSNDLCEKHYEQRKGLSQNITNKRLIRREKGLCETCGKKPLIRENRICNTCEVCYLKQIAKKHLGSAKLWMILKDLFDKQFVCPYTGINLVLGVNTSLDHIKSISKGGDAEIKNLQWVYFDRYGYFDVNRMKGALSHEEYKAAIKIQYEYLFQNES